MYLLNHKTVIFLNPHSLINTSPLSVKTLSSKNKQLHILINNSYSLGNLSVIVKNLIPSSSIKLTPFYYVMVTYLEFTDLWELRFKEVADTRCRYFVASLVDLGMGT